MYQKSLTRPSERIPDPLEDMETPPSSAEHGGRRRGDHARQR